MINRIIDSFVLELPDELKLRKSYDCDIEYQFDLFQNGKIRVMINCKDIYVEDNNENYYDHIYSNVNYYWFDTIEELTHDMLKRDGLGQLSGIMNILLKVNTMKIYNYQPEELTIKILNSINQVANQIKEHYNQIMNENIYT